MTKRVFVKKGIAELEKLFDQQKNDSRFLDDLVGELEFRKTQRALKLKQTAIRQKRSLEGRTIEPEAEPRLPIDEPKPNKQFTAAAKPKPTPSKVISSKPAPIPVERAAPAPTEITNDTAQILRAWTAMEVLSPASFDKPEKLAGGSKWDVAWLENGLPWETGQNIGKKNYRLYYQIILGTIDLESAVSSLLSVYTDSRIERPPAKGEAVLASVIVDKDGRPVDEDGLALSSFGWGVPIALSGNLNGLGAWTSAEKSLLEKLNDLLVVEDEDRNVLPLNLEGIEEAYEWLLEATGLDRRLTKAPTFAIRQFQYYTNSEAPESVLLNSFFLGDLALATGLAQQDKLTSNLSLYLGDSRPTERRNLLRETDAIQDALEPKKFPKGAWPGDGRYPLVTLQQCAVNLASHDLKQEGILAVNGPPGTGKTTLLRDVIASIVTDRARVMASYRDPETAFTHSGQKLKKGQAFVHLYRLDDKLRGSEIVVASSNNKAVENVSAELPGIEAVAKDADDLRYFKTVSDQLLQKESWGAIAAVLGNAGNRAQFRKMFWWDEDHGLHTYLKHASGSGKLVSEGQGEDRTQRPPIIVDREDAPEDHDQALRRWRKAVAKFKELDKAVEQEIAEYQAAHELAADIGREKAVVELLLEEIENKAEERETASASLKLANDICIRCQSEVEAARAKLDERLAVKPGFLKRLFDRANYRIWRAAYDEAGDQFELATSNNSQAVNQHREAEAALVTIQEFIRSGENTIAQKRQHIDQTTNEYHQLINELGGTPIDDDFFDQSSKERQTAAPWFSEKLSRLRQDLFQQAMAVHKAFVDAAAKPIRHNLNILLDGFGTRSLGSAEKDALIPHMWSTLFLVVPAVSTTFASVSRMFGRLHPNELGWLLIDEAGQALPQAAVGAIMRTKRAIVVGDPIQIEPVVMLPESLTEAICKQFGIDPLIYNAPQASAQTMADSATSYFATFEAQFGTREVGVPLLVHRRCANPMFSISNHIAYEDQMVPAKAEKQSNIKSSLGSPRWIDVRGDAQEKWCPQEGLEVLKLLQAMRQSRCRADVYIVTPFVVVQNRMRELLRRERIMEGWVDEPGRWINERIGTVHTVQGREAEAVIMILGAPRADQRGARGWAGGRPNLLNVAVTRAKETLYIVGNRELWREAGHFKTLDAYLN
ncbi:AAA domain-containing protein [Roseibium sp. FZY0029]|uniref:AAA domain-containing protein n=1 Tax=Roseibium sp. FZY0029 TaxID=3116647 RepID=UPI002EC11151|nr:AAA domain-containing protein [Roseibium sp. FZY0029]